MPKPIRIGIGVVLTGLFIVYGLEPFLKYFVAPFMFLFVFICVLAFLILVFRKPNGNNNNA